jgi:hypothetical protein
MTETENKQRRTFKKQTKIIAPKVKKERVYKKEKTCHQINKCKCDVHDRPCRIIVRFPPKDSRNAWRKQLNEMGAENHNVDSEHRCEECEKDRQENSPWQGLEVEGLNDEQIKRLSEERAAAKKHNRLLGSRRTR